MDIPLRARLWAILAACGLVAACSTKVCGLVGCQDQFDARIASADGTIPPGTHVVELTADGATISCTFQVPLAQLPGGGTAVPQCPSGLQVFIRQASNCTETMTGSARTLTCVPIAGHFFEDVTVTGNPAEVRVRVTVDGATVLDRTEAPTYETNQPNGPGCDPTCHQASAEWVFAAP